MGSKVLKIENRVLFPVILDSIAKGHTASIIARGYSMRPFIEHNRDTLTFGCLEDIKVGDVVLAQLSSGDYVCHRIVDIHDDTITLRGDGNWASTETCTVSDLRAQLVLIERKGREYRLSTSRVWKIYSATWMFLLPLRRYILAILRRV